MPTEITTSHAPNDIMRSLLAISVPGTLHVRSEQESTHIMILPRHQLSLPVLHEQPPQTPHNPSALTLGLNVLHTIHEEGHLAAKQLLTHCHSQQLLILEATHVHSTYRDNANQLFALLAAPTNATHLHQQLSNYLHKASGNNLLAGGMTSLPNLLLKLKRHLPNLLCVSTLFDCGMGSVALAQQLMQNALWAMWQETTPQHASKQKEKP